jgi:predicted dehydrogenase
MITGLMIDALKVSQRATYLGSFSRDPEHARAYTAEHGGVQPFSSLDAIAHCPDVDAVYVASPNALHAAQAIQMVEAGKHVLVEKPFASNRREALSVFEAARASGVHVMEAMRTLHDPAFRAVREALPRLGTTRSACIRYGKRSSRYDEYLAGRHTNIFDASMATGALMDLGVYCVEPMVELFGIPNDIRCFSTKLAGGIDAAGGILADYDDLVCELAYSKITNDLVPSQVQGEAATLVVDHMNAPTSAIITRLDGTSEDVSLGAGCDGPSPSVMAHEVDDFCAAIAGELDILHYQKVTLASLAIMDEARYQCGISFPADEED